MSWLALVVAQQILAQHPTIVTFCEPCGDRVPREPVQWAGEPVDPATTYVQMTPERFDNLAVLLGAPVAGVSPSLRVEAATSDGVLIVPDKADNKDVLPFITCREPDTLRTVKRPQITMRTDWGAIAVGCGATSALWLAALRLRRRRQHRPRLR